MVLPALWVVQVLRELMARLAPLEGKEILVYKVHRGLKAKKGQGGFQEKQVRMVKLALRDCKELRVILGRRVKMVKRVILDRRAKMVKKVILVLMEKQELLEKMEGEHLLL